MKDAVELHEAAMELLDRAVVCLGDDKHNLTIQAFELEREAAMMLAEDVDLTAVRSMLFVGAINLAFRLGKFQDAGDLTNIAFQGYIHKDFVEQLKACKEKSDAILAV